MDWIKKNYDQFTLAVFAAGLVAVSAMTFLNTSGFSERFSAAVASPNPNNTIPAIDTAVIDQARQQLEQPTVWKERNAETDQNGGLLFTSERYIATGRGLKKIKDDALWMHSRTKEPIPNKWVLEHGFSVLDKDQARKDSDGDGFWNEDEWLYQTDPNKKDSHPEYHTLLFLNRFIPVAFRLKFQSYDGDLKKPEGMTFQINTLDLRQPSEFLKLGETVAKTKFKLMKFEFKETENKGTGSTEEVSELTVVNTETEETVVLIYNKIVDSPNQYAAFDYYLVAKDISDGIKPFQFTVQRLHEFVLRPDVASRYKLLDVKAEEAVIQLPNSKKYTVLKHPKPGTSAP